MQNLAVGHDTPPNAEIPLGAIEASTNHRWPSQRSANATRSPRSALEPTAVHVVDVGHDTALNLETVASGTVPKTHAAPSHRSASAPLGPDPTAMHSLPDEHETASSRPLPATAGAGTGSSAHTAATACDTPIPTLATITQAKTATTSGARFIKAERIGESPTSQQTESTR